MDEWIEPFLAGGGVVGIITGIGILIRHFYRGRGGFLKAKANADGTTALTQVEIDERQAEIDQRRDAVAIRELRRSLEIMRQDRKSDREEIHKVRDELGVVSNRLALCQVDCARKDERIKSLEDAVRRLEDQLGLPSLPPEGPRSGRLGTASPPADSDTLREDK